MKGGRSLGKLVLGGGLVGLTTLAQAQTPLCSGQHPGNPQLISGTASCLYQEVGGVGRTVISLASDSVIHWEHLGLANPASSLVFENTTPGSADLVLNRVFGGNAGVGNSTHRIAGSIEYADGELVVLNPSSRLLVEGKVTADRMILSTHDLDPAQQDAFLNGESADFVGATKLLTISPSGRLEATEGDVVLTASAIELQGGPQSELVAQSGSVRAYAGEAVRVRASGQERLQGLGGSPGVVRNFRTIGAKNVVELRGGGGVVNGAGGTLEADGGAGRIFLRLDDGRGQIRNDGLLRGFVTSDQPPTGTGTTRPDETDALSGVSTGVSWFSRARPPEAKPDPKAKEVVVYEQGATAGSASAQRDQAKRTKRPALARKAPLARGRSFFGLRGGTARAGTTRKSSAGSGR